MNTLPVNRPMPDPQGPEVCATSIVPLVDVAPPYTLVHCRHGLMVVNRNDIYIGQALIRYGEYSELEAQFLLFLLQLTAHAGRVVEVGANIGTHTVPLARYLAAAGREMTVFEPQPFVFQNLCANLALNGIGNVRAWPWACGSQTCTVYFPRPDYDRLGNFGGVSMRAEASADLISVPCVRLDDVLADASGGIDVSLIKLDVEGFERAVLLGAIQTMRRCRPTLYLENDRVEHSRALIETLWAEDYRVWWHICPLFNPLNFRGEQFNDYPNLSSFNMVALPRETGLVVPGCVEVTDADYHPLRRDQGVGSNLAT